MITKIGVGFITCNRPDYLKSLLDSLVPCKETIDELVVVNDGQPVKVTLFKGEYILNKTNLGVGKSKNKALKYLLNKNCDYLFLIEDDVVIFDKNVFKEYIEASKLSGIHHFNYGPGTPFNRKQNAHFDLHNRHEINQDSEPSPRIVIDYNTIKIALYTHVAGMFSFFTKEVLQKVGLIDEQFYNAWDHVDHTYRIIKAGYHPQFWWFADLENSHKLLGEAKSSITKSAIAKDTQEWFDTVYKGREAYLQKHGHYPNQPPLATKEEVILTLKKIWNKHYKN